MTADLDAAGRVAVIGEGAAKLLCSPRRPIVICPRKTAGESRDALPDLLAPDTASIGLMLPSTPLHHLLFHPEWAGGRREDALPALVMTSGNPHGAPLSSATGRQRSVSAPWPIFPLPRQRHSRARGRFRHVSRGELSRSPRRAGAHGAPRKGLCARARASARASLRRSRRLGRLPQARSSSTPSASPGAGKPL